MSEYKVGTIGRNFLKSMEIKHNYEEKDPSKILGALKSDDWKRDFQYSVYNPNFYPRAATDIMETIFTPAEKERLQGLISELEEEDASLIASASSKANGTIESIKKAAETSTSTALADIIENTATAITCEIFKFIPPYALNLLGLIGVEKVKFPQSYHSFKQVLETLNQDEVLYDPGKIKKYFSQALEELGNLVESVKKKKPDKTKVENETPPEQTPPLTRTSQKEIKMSLLTQTRSQKDKIIQKTMGAPMNLIMILLLTWNPSKLKLSLRLPLPSMKSLS